LPFRSVTTIYDIDLVLTHNQKTIPAFGFLIIFTIIKQSYN